MYVNVYMNIVNVYTQLHIWIMNKIKLMMGFCFFLCFDVPI